MAYASKEQQNEYQRQWIAKRRYEFFKDKACVKCGSTDKLELDHIDRSTKVSHNIWSWSKERQAVEIAKCQILCYKCHKEKTRSEFITTEHGTYAMRVYHGCTCIECKEYVRASKAEWRARTGKH